MSMAKISRTGGPHLCVAPEEHALRDRVELELGNDTGNPKSCRSTINLFEFLVDFK